VVLALRGDQVLISQSDSCVRVLAAGLISVAKSPSNQVMAATGGKLLIRSFLAGCGKRSFFSKTRNPYNAESKPDYS
jgi:hypothetical protein